MIRLQIFAPTAGNASITGRVFSDQSGLINAVVVMTDQNGSTRSVRTSSFGTYHFGEVAAGQIYVVTVQSKRYRFAAQVVSVAQDIGELDFYG